MNCTKCNAILIANAKFCEECGETVQQISTQANCSKCNSLLRPNAKFCEVCGEVASLILYCRKCKAPLKANAKFCEVCGEKVNSNEIQPPSSAIQNPIDSSSSDSISLIKGRICWSIPPGEMARRFNESDLINLDTATGIIINEGTTAIIKSEGKFLFELRGGTYDFIEEKALKERLNQRQGGLAGGLREGFQFLANLVLGTKVKENNKTDNDSEKNQDAILSSLMDSVRLNRSMSVTLMLNKSFPLVFEFDNIQTKYLDTTIGFHALFSIKDYDSFFNFYLSDNKSVSSTRIQDEISPIIRNTLIECLNDFDQVDVVLPGDIQNKISINLEKIAGDLFHGIQILNIISVSSKNDDIERFRKLARELYLSEKELDYQSRLNEFRNRMTLQINSQKLNESKTELEFKKSLNQLNKDHLLEDDELDKFYMVLSREKLIREAKNDDDIEAALTEIKKTGLLREEDLLNLKTTIRESSEDHEFARYHSIDIMQMNYVLESDKKKLEWEYEIGDSRIQLELDRKRIQLQSQIGFTKLEIENWKTSDEYTDGRWEIDLQQKKVEARTKLELENEEMDAQIERMRKLKEIEASEKKLQHELTLEERAQQQIHERESDKQKLDAALKKAELYKDMTPEQLMAIASNENMSPDAAKAFAESFSAKNSGTANKEFMEQFNQLNEKRIDDIKNLTSENAALLERMMNKVLDTQSSMSGHLVHSKDQIKDEYKERLARTEDRMDNTQDKALDYTTKNNVPPAPNPPTLTNFKVCSTCNTPTTNLDAKICSECGTRF
jgi:hypothetical protein